MREEELDRLFRLAIAEGAAIREFRQQMQAHAAYRRDAVISLREIGVSYSQIAERLGCSRSAVQSILRGGTDQVSPALVSHQP